MKEEKASLYKYTVCNGMYWISQKVRSGFSNDVTEKPE